MHPEDVENRSAFWADWALLKRRVDNQSKIDAAINRKSVQDAYQ